jgi:DNA-binding MarR family transcriptional regulator
MTRRDDVDRIYQQLTIVARRARELSEELHPGLSLGAYSLLSYIEVRTDVRAADIATLYGLDKSTVSRQLDQLESDGLLVRIGERPGRRGQSLALTAAGRAALDKAAASARASLAERLAGWGDHDIETFAGLVARFNGPPDRVAAAASPPVRPSGLDPGDQGQTSG